MRQRRNRGRGRGRQFRNNNELWYFSNDSFYSF
jgi:hypothetical protein